MANVEHEQAPDQLAANGPGKSGQGGDAPSSQGSAPAYDEAQMDPAEYARLLDIYDNSFRNIAEGEVVKGTVLKVTESEVIVDVGFKSEGIIPIDEFLDENRQVTVQPGDVVDVLLEKTEDREGYVVLSREKAEKMKIWDEVEKAFADRKVVIGRVIERIKGGLAVDIGVRAFLPAARSTCGPCATSTLCVARSCACASSRSTRSAEISCSRARCCSRKRTRRRRSPRSRRWPRVRSCAVS